MTFIRNWRSIICRKRSTLQTFYRTLSELISYCKTTSLKFAKDHHWTKISWQPDKVYSYSIQCTAKSITKKHWQLQSWKFFSKQNCFHTFTMWIIDTSLSTINTFSAKQHEQSMKSESKSAPLPTNRDCLLWIKVFPSLSVFSYDANKHWKQLNHPNPTYRYLLFVFVHGEVRSQHMFILFKERQIKINPQHATYKNGIISKQKKIQHVK